MTDTADIAHELVRLFPATEYGPSVVVDHGIYTVRWTDPEWVTFEFDLLTTDRRTGDTSAEVVVTLTSEGDHRILHRSRLNLLSTVAQDRLAKYLGSRTPHLKVKWTEVISTSCGYVLEEYRRGEPAILLRDAQEPAHGPSLVPPFLAPNGTTILFGDGGTGKSLIGLTIAASIQTGDAFIEGLPPTGQATVGYLDWEWEAHVHRRRLAKLNGAGELPGIVYVPCRVPISEDRDRLRHLIRDHQIGFLIVDSVALACGGEPESAEVALTFFNTLRQLAVPTLCIAHVTNAAAKSSADRPFGSAFWHNTARSTWYARRSDGSGQDRLAVGLFNKKANDEAHAAPIGLNILFGDRITVERGDVREEPDLDRQRPVRARVADFLGGGPRLIHEIADELEVSPDAVRMALRRGQDKQFISITRPDGIESWGLRARD